MRSLNKIFLFLSIILILNFFSASELKVTEEHLFLVDGKWIPASQLNVGDFLQTSDGEKVVITEIEDIETKENFSVYNLEVGEFHNFVNQSYSYFNSFKIIFSNFFQFI